MSEIKFDGTIPMSPAEREQLINFIIDVQKLYKKHGNKNRFLYDCFNAIIRPLTLNIGQYNNCKVSKAVKERMGEFKNIREFDRKKTGKNIIKEHVKPLEVLLEEFYQGFNNKDAENWFDSCEIAFITKEEDVELREAEKEIRLRKDSKSVYDIHKEAYKKTGLDKKLEKFKIK